MIHTTDPQDELFEIYDAAGLPTGRLKRRGDVHRDGDWHRAIHIWVWRINPAAEPEVIFQRRSLTKDTWPGALDVAIGGHIRAGETLAETVREAEEELGLDVTLDDLTPLGRRFQPFASDAFNDFEINEVFAYRCDQPLDRYRLHPEEIDSLVSAPLIPALRLFEGEHEAIQAVEQAPGQSAVSFTMRPGDFPVTGDDYPIQTLRAIVELAAGREVEPFLIQPDRAS